MAGVKTGDIITKFNGVDIKSFDELEREKNKYKAGDKVELTIYRIPQKGDASQGVSHYLVLVKIRITVFATYSIRLTVLMNIKRIKIAIKPVVLAK